MIFCDYAPDYGDILLQYRPYYADKKSPAPDGVSSSGGWREGVRSFRLVKS